MHIEFHNPKVGHSFYAVNKNDEVTLTYWHPEVASELHTYDADKTVKELLDELRPMINTLLTAFDSIEPWNIRLFKFDGVKHSLTRGVVVIEEFITGDEIFINGVKQEIKIHPKWKVKI